MKALRTARWFCVAALMAVAGVWGQPVPPVVAPVPSAAPQADEELLVSLKAIRQRLARALAA